MLDQSFRDQARRTPALTAVIDGEIQWTYAELAAKADRVSAYLQARGVSRGDVVALRLPKTADFVAAYIGVLQARAAYLPLSGETEHRVQQIYARVAPAAVLDRTTMAEALSFTGAFEHQLGELDDPAYMVFSSGTTGEPKGILCPHRGAVLSYRWRHALRPYGEGYRVGANVFFVWELLRPLLVGATLVVIPDDVIYDPPVLVPFLRRHRVQETLFTPSLLRTVLDLVDDVDLPELETLYLNGEVVTKDLLGEALRRLPAQLWNLYSISECHEVGCVRMSERFLETPDAPSYEREIADTFERGAVSIGSGFEQLTLRIMQDGRDVPEGQVGELYVDTPCLAIGYLGQPDLTAQRFPTVDGRRVYRTGDLAWRDPRGDVHLMGRCDAMIKLRGYSIFLGRIEAALEEQPGVQACALTVQGEGHAKHIVAHVVPTDDAAWTIDPVSCQCPELRRGLARMLPPESIPARFLAWSRLPIAGETGKLDTRALRARGSASSVEASDGILRVFQDVLGFPVSVDDTFVGLGGQSLQAAELSVKLRARGIEIRVADLLGQATIGALCAGAREEVDDDQLAADVAELSPTWKIPPTAHARRFTVSGARRILVTGGTGFLGAWLVDHLLRATDAEVLCLHRGNRKRLAAARRRLGLSSTMKRVVPLRGDLAKPGLGLSASHRELAAGVDLIVHAGALVNYAYPYASMRGANAVGTQQILALAAEGAPSAVHLFSSSAVFPRQEAVCDEATRASSVSGLEGGYGQSKWVAECLGERASERGLPVAVFRPGNIGPDSQTGAGNAADYQIWVLAAAMRLGCVPRDTGWWFEMTPVDHLLALWRDLADGVPWGERYHLLQTTAVPADTVFGWLHERLGLAWVDRDTWDARIAAAPDDPHMEVLRTSMAAFEAWFTWPNTYSDAVARAHSGLAHPGFSAGLLLRSLAWHARHDTLPLGLPDGEVRARLLR